MSTTIDGQCKVNRILSLATTRLCFNASVHSRKAHKNKQIQIQIHPPPMFTLCCATLRIRNAILKFCTCAFRCSFDTLLNYVPRGVTCTPQKFNPFHLPLRLQTITFNFRLHIAIKSTLDRAHKLPAFNSFVIAIAWLQLAPDNLQKIK